MTRQTLDKQTHHYWQEQGGMSPHTVRHRVSSTGVTQPAENTGMSAMGYGWEHQHHSSATLSECGKKEQKKFIIEKCYIMQKCNLKSVYAMAGSEALGVEYILIHESLNMVLCKGQKMELNAPSY